MQFETVLTILLYTIVFMYGICIGSFTNVLIYRIPLNENIATESSHCMSCGKKIKWYDLVPLISYIILRGRCRHCKAKISVQYPLVELISGIGYVLVFATNGFNLISAVFCLVFSCLVVITVIDWKTYEIYDCMINALLVLGIIRAAMDYHNIINYVIGFFAVSGFLFLIYYISKERAMGFGDVKLMAVAGLILGWKEIVLAFVLGAIIGSVIHIVLMLVLKKEHVLALGPYLSAGIYVTMLFGNDILSWYLKYLKS